MKDFQVQTIWKGRIVDTRPVAALFSPSLWDAMGRDSSGYIINPAGERVATFEIGRTWRKINYFPVHNRFVRPDGTVREIPKGTRSFTVLWDNKHASVFGSFETMLAAISKRS